MLSSGLMYLTRISYPVCLFNQVPQSIERSIRRHLYILVRNVVPTN